MDPRPLVRFVRPLSATLLSVALTLGVAACGDDDEPTATGDQSGTTADHGSTTGGAPYDYGSTTGGTGGSTDDTGDAPSVVAQGVAFADDLTVAPGEEFIFDNQDSAVHTLTADDGAFDSGEVPGGNHSDPMTAPDEPGAYAFHCEIHGSSMSGTLTVEGK